MTYSQKDKDISQKLRNDEINELREYCKESGFTPEQTEIFIKNSLASIYPEEDE